MITIFLVSWEYSFQYCLKIWVVESFRASSYEFKGVLNKFPTDSLWVTIIKSGLRTVMNSLRRLLTNPQPQDWSLCWVNTVHMDWVARYSFLNLCDDTLIMSSYCLITKLLPASKMVALPVPWKPFVIRPLRSPVPWDQTSKEQRYVSRGLPWDGMSKCGSILQLRSSWSWRSQFRRSCSFCFTEASFIFGAMNPMPWGKKSTVKINPINMIISANTKLFDCPWSFVSKIWYCKIAIKMMKAIIPTKSKNIYEWFHLIHWSWMCVLISLSFNPPQINWISSVLCCFIDSLTKYHPGLG